MGKGVFVGLRPIGLWVLATGGRFQIKIVRQSSPLFQEVTAQLQIPLFAGRPEELHQGKLDFRVTAVPTLLRRLRPESRIDMIGVAAHDIKEASLSGGLEVSDSRFDQVPRAI